MSGETPAIREALAVYAPEAPETERVPPGYKQTEVGVIPEDWELLTLADIRESGGLVRGPFGGALKKEFFVDTRGYKVYEQRNAIYKSAELGTYFVDESKFRELSRFKVKAGDFIVSCSGTIGRVFQIPEGAKAGIINQALLKIKVDSGTVLDQYFFYVFESDQFQKRIIDNTHGGAMQNLVGMDTFRDTEIPIPSLSEQCAIAAALSDVDALISSLDRLISKKRAVKTAAMQQLLTGKQRLPGFSGEWEVRRLADLGKTYGGITGKTKVDFGQGAAKYIPFLNVMNNVVVDVGDLASVAISDSENQNRTKKNDLFFNGSSETPEELGMCSVLLEDVERVYLNSFCFGFRLNSGAGAAYAPYLAYFFRSGEGRKLLHFLAQGATRYNLSKTNFLRLEIPLPEQREQTAIATVLSDMDVEISALEARREKTRRIKQGMMQELLTGRTRLA